MISADLKKVILQTLNLGEWDLRDDTLATEVPGWDSLNHINVLLAVEEHFKTRFKTTELLNLRNVGDLQRLVDSKTGKW